MLTIGIDPGLDGAIGWVVSGPMADPRAGEFMVHDAPTLKSGVASKKGKARREYDEQGLRHLLVALRDPASLEGRPILAVLEKQGPMPKQNISATFSQAQGYGLWRGLLSGLQIPYRIVTPQAWKKALMEGQPRTAEASVAAALRYFPTARPLLVGPKGGLKDGRADALLLAHYAQSGH